MLFNSPEFICFVVIVYILYVLLPFRQQNLMLLVVSYVFYGWWDTRFLFLVALSTTVDFWVGLTLGNGRLTLIQRVMPAMFLVASAFTFLGLDLGAIFGHYSSLNPSHTFVLWQLIPSISLGIAVYLLILHYVYTFLQDSNSPRARVYCLAVSLITQLGLLGVFKYYNFFSDNLQAALLSLGINVDAPRLNIILPVGISFYTFQSLSYTIDIYRKQFRPTDRFSEFALFVAYFPQLQAGPIERGRQLIPQLSCPRILSPTQTFGGLYLIVLGLFKKVAIADGVAPVVDKIFNSSGAVSWIDVIAGSFYFSAQIYCDFSGYIDIARGVSKLLGIELVQNFDHPYFSTTPREFWRRWNISLSKWLRDYVYISLGGNAGNLLFICRNLMVTMLLGGLWHGAAWNYILWGFYQGALLCGHRILAEQSLIVKLKYRLKPRSAMITLSLHVIANALFFVLVCYGWLIFRAHSLTQIVNFTSLLVSDFGDLDYGGGAPRLSAVVGLVLLAAIEIAQHWSGDPYVHRKLLAPARGFYVALLLAITMMGMSNEPAQFIYFQF